MPIKLGEVLFPLRYDVWDQFPEVKRLGSMRRTGIRDLLELGRNTSIHRHTVIADPVYQAIGALAPFTGAELDYRIERYYGAHLEKLTSYYVSIDQGWDETKDKILYHHVSNPTVTSIGNPVPGDGLFLTNGQHRTTVLLALGYTELPDSIAAIDERDGSTFIPLDMTYAYIVAGACTELSFVNFARFRFPAIPAQITDVQSLSTWMKFNGPQWVVDYIKLYWRDNDY